MQVPWYKWVPTGQDKQTSELQVKQISRHSKQIKPVSSTYVPAGQEVTQL